jgi:hypothetical protein
VTAATTPLRLDTTGQHLGGPLLGPHDNRTPDDRALRRATAALRLVL